LTIGANRSTRFCLDNPRGASSVPNFPDLGEGSRRYLHSCSILSSACARPLSEYWSVDWVPRPEVPFTVRSAPLRMASTMRVSSAAFLIQAPSSLVYIANLAVPTWAVASELVLNG